MNEIFARGKGRGRREMMYIYIAVYTQNISGKPREKVAVTSAAGGRGGGRLFNAYTFIRLTFLNMQIFYLLTKK